MIYFDNNATTRIAPEVFEAMKPWLAEEFGNPSSSHAAGREAKAAIDAARASVAGLIGAALPDEIVFTSSGTESDNWAIMGSVAGDRNHIVTTAVEHEAVRNVCNRLEIDGLRVTRLSVDEDGLLDFDQLKSALGPDTAIVSVMLANNETGILFPVEEIGRIVKEHSDALFHVDGVNAVGKIEINVERSAIDLFSLSGHKFHAPKGIGALYIKKGVDLKRFMIGGGQERGLRAGTEAVHQIVGLGAAAELARDLAPMERVAAMRDRLEDQILNNIPNCFLNGTGDRTRRLPNTSNISFENTNGEMILMRLDQMGICVSTGSACNAGHGQASATLQAMNIPYSRTMGSIRFSLGRFNTEAEIDKALDVLGTIVNELRRLSG